MDKPKFVYVSYINSTPEKVWNALIDPEVTKQYWWNHHNASDWKAGSRWEHRDYDSKRVDIVGQVVESTPPRRLVVTWALPADEGNKDKTSRVTYDIEPAKEGVVRLTVTHEELYQEMYESVSFGWPAVVSALKTLLETGTVGAQAGATGCE
ncbi:MAG TPA: SRPBCC family protein [Blastocatellia bacterium]|nr:SRPBCC family protein [Blastocatellia bacterium]